MDKKNKIKKIRLEKYLKSDLQVNSFSGTYKQSDMLVCWQMRISCNFLVNIKNGGGPGNILAPDTF